MRFAGLFAGIGGFERGLSSAGHEPLLLCEIDPAAQSVLRTRFPGVRLATDVRALAHLPRGTELVCAGFPCQDLSQAGPTAGLAGERSRLVFDVFRLVEKGR